MYGKTKFLEYVEITRKFIYFLIKRAQQDTVLRVASSLSYTCLIALVPLLAIALAIFSAFPVFSEIRQQVQDFIINNVVPDIGQDISIYFNEFIAIKT